jgi:hypothetical protein
MGHKDARQPLLIKHHKALALGRARTR